MRLLKLDTNFLIASTIPAILIQYTDLLQFGQPNGVFAGGKPLATDVKSSIGTRF
jgi:hypothetical protein